MGDVTLPLNALISAASGLLGVWIGGAITRRRQREERRHQLLREQLDRFYSPLFGLRARILAKSELRVKVSGAADTAWRLLTERAGDDIDAVMKLEQERFPDFERVIDENNRQLIEETLPLYRQMVEHFTDNMWLAEPSTRAFFGALVEFVEMWDRWLAGTLPKEIVRLLVHSEQLLKALYEEVERQTARLRSMLLGMNAPKAT